MVWTKGWRSTRRTKGDTHPNTTSHMASIPFMKTISAWDKFASVSNTESSLRISSGGDQRSVYFFLADLVIPKCTRAHAGLSIKPPTLCFSRHSSSMDLSSSRVPSSSKTSILSSSIRIRLNNARLVIQS